MSEHSTPADSATDPICDPGMLFRLSLLSDQLRETSKLLLSAEQADAPTCARMSERYGKVRSAVAGTVVDTHAKELLDWTPELPSDSSIGAIVDAAVSLSCFCDALMQTPAFLVNRRLQQAKIDATIAELGKKEPAAAAPATNPNATGQYL